MEKRLIHTVGKVESSNIIVEVPGSKSITNRALLLTTIAEGKSILEGALFSDDSRHFLQCVKDLGFVTEFNEEEYSMAVEGLGGRIPKAEASIYVGSAGTAARFLAGFLGCNTGKYFMDASEQMRKRPMEPLLHSLEQVGASITCTEEVMHFPMWIESKGISNHCITVDIDKSSQFLSALLISACLSKEDLTIKIEGSHGMAYVEMTIAMMKQFGVETIKINEREFLIKTGQTYQAKHYLVEPDLSAACYFFAMAAVLGISVTVKNTHFDSLQGDVAFTKVLEEMGCKVIDTKIGIQVTGPKDGKLKAVDVDMHSFSDQAITLAALAPFAEGVTRIRGVSHIRFHESNRIAAMVENLTNMGVQAIELEDGLEIHAGIPKATIIKTYDDHRLAMGFAITGLRADGIEIEDPKCCRKTFENYFDVLEHAVEEVKGEKRS